MKRYSDIKSYLHEVCFTLKFDDSYSNEYLDEIRKWIKTQEVISMADIYMENDYGFVAFKKKDDALFFKLIWGGGRIWREETHSSRPPSESFYLGHFKFSSI